MIPQKIFDIYMAIGHVRPFPDFFCRLKKSKFRWYSLFFEKKIFDQNFIYRKTILKNDKKIFGEQHNIKELSQKFF